MDFGLYKENKSLRKENQLLEIEVQHYYMLIECLNAYLMEKGKINDFIKWAEKIDYMDIVGLDNELLEGWEKIGE